MDNNQFWVTYRLRNNFFLVLMVFGVSCGGLGLNVPESNKRVRVLEDSIRLNKDTVIYRYSFADSYQYLCVGKGLADIYDDSKVIAELTSGGLALDSVIGRTIYVTASFDLEYPKQSSDFVITVNKGYQYGKKFKKFWYLVLKDSVGNYYLKDPQKQQSPD